MIRDITIGQHFPGNSLVHRLDPRMKIILTMGYIVLLFLAANPGGLVLATVLLGILYRVAKIPLKLIVKSLKPILPIILFTVVLNLFFITGQGSPLFEMGFIKVYIEGVRYAVLMPARWSMVWNVVTLFSTVFPLFDATAETVDGYASAYDRDVHTMNGTCRS